MDDGSTDGTREILREMDGKNGVRVFLQPQNQGEGRGGLRRLPPRDRGRRHHPGRGPRVRPEGVRRSSSGRSSTGTPTSSTDRASSAAGARRVLYFWHTVGNRFLTLASNMATNLNLTDMETCYKMFRREVVQSMTIESRRFGIEPEITAKVARRGYRVYEVADLLLRPDLRGGEEDRPEGRLLGALDDHPAPVPRGGGAAGTSATSRWRAWPSSSRTTAGSSGGSPTPSGAGCWRSGRASET